jgi:hypothetical protein
MEYLLYGLPKGETERYTENLLATRATHEAAEAVIERATLDGWHSFRIATFDGSPPDFTKVLKGQSR